MLAVSAASAGQFSKGLCSSTGRACAGHRAGVLCDKEVPTSHLLPRGEHFASADELVSSAPGRKTMTPKFVADEAQGRREAAGP